MNYTWRTFLYGATCPATNSITSESFRSASDCVTTNAFGTSSPDAASVTPITAASGIDALGGEQRVDGGGRGTGAQDAVEGDRERGTVRCQEADHIANADSRPTS